MILPKIFTAAFAGLFSLIAVSHLSAQDNIPSVSLGVAMLEDDGTLYFSAPDLYFFSGKKERIAQAVPGYGETSSFAVLEGGEPLEVEEVGKLLGDKFVPVVLVWRPLSSPEDAGDVSLAPEFRALFAESIPIVHISFCTTPSPEVLERVKAKLPAEELEDVQPAPFLGFLSRSNGESENEFLRVLALKKFVHETRSANATRVVNGVEQLYEYAFTVMRLVQETKVRETKIQETKPNPEDGNGGRLYRGREVLTTAQINEAFAEGRPVITCAVERFLDPYYNKYLAPESVVLYERPASFQIYVSEEGAVKYMNDFGYVIP